MSEGEVFDGDKDILALYWRHLADIMGLGDWSFTLASSPPPADTDDPEKSEIGAMIHFLYGRKYATLYIQDGWETWRSFDIRHTIVHELVHCHLHGMTMALNNVQTIIPVMTMDVVRFAFRDANEFATDAIAMAWAKFMPLPEEWLEDATSP